MTAPHTVLRSPSPTNVTSSGGMSRAYSLWRLGGVSRVTSCDRIREQFTKEGFKGDFNDRTRKRVPLSVFYLFK